MTSESPKAVGTATVARPDSRGRHRHADPARRPWAARPALLGGLALAVAVVAAGIALVVPAVTKMDRSPSGSAWQAAGTASPSPTAESPGPGAQGALAPASVDVDFAGTLSWALIEESGRISGSPDLSAPVPAESMVKAWIVADYLRRAAESGRRPSETRLAQASRAIRDGDVAAATSLNAASGGADQIGRMIAICRLTDSRPEGPWSRTRISARDAARLGRCIADGRAAGPSWTRWIRTEMTKVRGGTAKGGSPRGTRWGIVDGLPARVTSQGVGFENGWSAAPSGGQLRVNCLAVADGWSLAVLTRYSAERGLSYGAEGCAEVASQLIPPATPAESAAPSDSAAPAESGEPAT